ncbi:zinc metallochaperone AztD [Streptomyces iconiensis]|uniref:Zinc metallochaperone AztD n=1 Tax=Streptomyces iconiensis TaxID=1384038 RepID=A0ABT6ZSZ7_9ACTN|nr:zinc metallochaperone AztD [Streptomyces iconiensis]MDJ1132180.1 zinc metallochaperone AztD [Streptomyces iconiensis]
MDSRSRMRKAAAVSALLFSSVAIAACGGEDTGSGSAKGEEKQAASSVRKPLAVTYDGGISVLDGESLKVAKNVPLKGFNRVNPAGDDRHIMVSTPAGFRVLDAAGQKLTDVEFKGAEPGHVVQHAGKTVLFTDGTGETRIFDPAGLGSGKPKTETYKAPSPHHGVSVELENGELVTTLGTAKKRKGIVVLGKDRKEIRRSEKCPEVHGEATAKDEAVVIGCEDGALVYKDGKIKKVDSPDDYGRIGNQRGSEKSAVVLGDYKKDPEAELERPEQVSLIDTRTGKMKLVDLGASYSFKSLARGPEGEALVLGTDGKIHVIDPGTGKKTDSIAAVGKWREPMDWQQPRPELWVREGTAYVTDPGKKKIHAIDLASGEKKATGTLKNKPNEVSGVSDMAAH